MPNNPAPIRRKGNRALPMIPCQFCTKPIDKRGLSGHERFCLSNPAREANRKLALVSPRPLLERVSDGEIDRFIKVYRRGLEDGLHMHDTQALASQATSPISPSAPSAEPQAA